MKSDSLIQVPTGSPKKTLNLEHNSPKMTFKSEEKVFSGLCTNCDERFRCKICNNHSVIWHCEEYS